MGSSGDLLCVMSGAERYLLAAEIPRRDVGYSLYV